jgi:hypothetical protein
VTKFPNNRSACATRLSIGASSSPTAWVFGVVVVFGYVLGLIPSALAQRAFSVAIAPTNQNRVALSWKVQSATPIGDLFIIPQFRVQRTFDLKNWTSVSDLLSGSLGQILSLTDSNSTRGIYRIESVISSQYAELDNAS